MLASTYVPRPSQPLQQQPWARAFTAAGGGGDAGGGGGGGGGMNSGGSAVGGGAGEGIGFSQAAASGAFAGSVAPSGARGIASGGGGGGGSSIAAASSGMLMGSAAGVPTPAAGAGAQGHSVRVPCQPCPLMCLPGRAAKRKEQHGSVSAPQSSARMA